jgi:Tol biopolymer transport system component
MTTTDRIDRLPELLTELAAPRTPDYLDDILARTAGQRQRPARTLLERILPMSETTLPSVRTSPPAWRTFAIVLLLAALAVAIGAGALIASRPSTPLPAPFGPAANGRIAYSSDGDIYTADPLTGTPRALTSGRDFDSMPIFSRDGTKLAFARITSGQPGYDVVIAAPDGTGQMVITPDPLPSVTQLAWSPDGRTIAAFDGTPGANRLLILDATGTSPPRVLVEGVSSDLAFRPPAGREILVTRADGNRVSLEAVAVDGSGSRTIVEPRGGVVDQWDLGSAAWSPDGSMIAVTRAPLADDNQFKVVVMSADGSGERVLASEPTDGLEPGTTWSEANPKWSPASTHIAIQRWTNSASGDAAVHPIGIVDVADGTVIDAGPAAPAEGMSFDWSPDGTSILVLGGNSKQPILVEPDNGLPRSVFVTTDSPVSWQRVAP